MCLARLDQTFLSVDFENEYMKEFNSHKYIHPFISKLRKIKHNITEDAMDNCARNLQYRAEVIFRLATDSMSVTVMSSRLSFFDKMSAFGKITESGHLIIDISFN